MGTIEIVLLFLMTSLFFIIMAILIIAAIMAERRNRRRGSAPVPYPTQRIEPPRDGGAPSAEPESGSPIEIEEVGFKLAEGTADPRIKLKRKMKAETERIWPAVKIRVNRKSLAGRILPTTFKIVDSKENVLYEHSLAHKLKQGINMITVDPNSPFPIQGKAYAVGGTVWELQLLVSGRLLVRAKLRVQKDVMKELRSKKLSAADGELNVPAENLIDETEDAPAIEDLIDN